MVRFGWRWVLCVCMYVWWHLESSRGPPVGGRLGVYYRCRMDDSSMQCSSAVEDLFVGDELRAEHEDYKCIYIYIYRWWRSGFQLLCVLLLLRLADEKTRVQSRSRVGLHGMNGRRLIDWSKVLVCSNCRVSRSAGVRVRGLRSKTPPSSIKVVIFPTLIYPVCSLYRTLTRYVMWRTSLAIQARWYAW